MTLDACKERYLMEKEKGNEKEAQFWKDRLIRKAKGHDKYKDVNIDEFLGEEKPKEVKHVKTKKR